MRLVDGKNEPVEADQEAIVARLLTQGMVSTDEDKDLSVQREDPDWYSVTDDQNLDFNFETASVYKAASRFLGRLNSGRAG